MPTQMSHFFNQFDYAALLQNAIRIAIIIAIAIGIWGLIQLVIARFVERMVKRAEAKGHGVHGARQRADTIAAVLRKIIAAVYWIVVVLTLLSQIGVNIGALVAGAGIVGLAVSFGAQTLVKDYISGFFMVFENQISVGDIAIINGTWGTVEAINFRTTLLRNMDGTLHIYSNGAITQLTNATKDWGGFVFKMHVSYKEDTDHVVTVLQRVGKEMKNDRTVGANMISDMEVHGVTELTDSAVVIRGRFKTTPMNQWSTGREFLARVKRAFDEEGIQIARPRQSVYFGEQGLSLSIARIGNAGEDADVESTRSSNPG